MKAKPRMLAPSECNTSAKLDSLTIRELYTPESWIKIDGDDIGIVNQRAGRSPSGCVYLTVADMRKFARWFLRKQRCK